MRISLAPLVVFSVIALGVLGAQSNATIKHVPLSPTSPASGKEMFVTYCAVCHGADGKGGGPAAAALKAQPSNLSQLTAKNGGTFPELRLVSTLSAGDVVAHGSAEMPVWGDLFKSLDGGQRNMSHMRIANLVGYVKSIQAK
jgi:mono/diheme cytochrome c family protein